MYIVCSFCLGIIKTSCFFFISTGRLWIFWKFAFGSSPRLVEMSQKKMPFCLSKRFATVWGRSFNAMSARFLLLIAAGSCLCVLSVLLAQSVLHCTYFNCVLVFFSPHRWLKCQYGQTRSHGKSQCSPFLPNPFQASSWVASYPLAAFSSSSSSFSTASGTLSSCTCELFK